MLGGSHLGVGVHGLFCWPLPDPLPLSPPAVPLSLPLPLPLPVAVSTLFTVAVSGALAGFPAAAVVGRGLAAPLEGEVFLAVTADLTVWTDRRQREQCGYYVYHCYCYIIDRVWLKTS